MALDVHITEVAVKDYKSIASCAVSLKPLSFLVGPNGSGKSNFLDALAFCADSLRHSLDQAIRDRGGINEVRRRSSGRPNHFAIRLDVEIGQRVSYEYYFEIGARPKGQYAIQEEQCRWAGLIDPNETGEFHVRRGKIIKSTLGPSPVAADDQLYLVRLSGIAEFRELYRGLSGMGFYSINPSSIRDLQPPNPGDLLTRDGSNLASVLSMIERRDSDSYDRILEYLKRVVPSIDSVRAKPLGPKETLEFIEKAHGQGRDRRFYAANMSDGTLRALGVIVALFQESSPHSVRCLVGLEEPEIALHPAAAGFLYDCLREGAESRQVLVTSHSPDLLDRDDIPEGSLLAVSSDEGHTSVAAPDQVSVYAIRERLRTPGELLRIGQLNPDSRRSTAPAQMRLF